MSSTVVTCERCGMTFKYKSNLTKHLSRKNPCKEIVKNERIVIVNTHVDTADISMSENMFTFIDLFCGVGGFHQALSSLGGKCVLACDVDKECRNIYEKNYGLKPHDDVCKLDESNLPKFDIICGGFPCQPFSNAGKKQCRSDSRGQLFDEIIRIAQLRNPKFMFLENVKHIMKISNGEVMKYIIQTLDDNGYKVFVNTLSPHQLGIPQQRERVIFSCIRKDIYDKNPTEFVLDVPDIFEMKSIFQEDEEIDDIYKVGEPLLSVFNAWDEMVKVFEVGQKMSPTILCAEFNSTYTPEEFASLPQWKRDYIEKNRPIYEKYKEHWDEWFSRHEELLRKREIYCKLEWQAGEKQKDDSIFNHFIQVRQSGIRVKRTKYFPTLVAMVQTPIYGKKMRYITPRECARLQSFPDSFILHPNPKVAYKQFGNAVNVDVIRTVAGQVLELYT